MPKPTTIENPEAVVIRHLGLYWAPLNCGYTHDLLRGGVYEPFKPWRDDTLVPLHGAMTNANFSDDEKAFLSARAKKDVLAYGRKVSPGEEAADGK